MFKCLNYSFNDVRCVVLLKHLKANGSDESQINLITMS